MKRLIFSSRAWEEYLHWQEVDEGLLERINTLIKDVRRNPFTGIGKPEPLRHDLKGFWSRRITSEHRLVYRVTADAIEFASFRYHY